MLPTIGNHEYNTTGATGYFDYFGAVAIGPDGYYATDVGAWRVYVLNSECSFVACTADLSAGRLAECGPLAANPRECVARPLARAALQLRRRTAMQTNMAAIWSVALRGRRGAGPVRA